MWDNDAASSADWNYDGHNVTDLIFTITTSAPVGKFEIAYGHPKYAPAWKITENGGVFLQESENHGSASVVDRVTTPICELHYWLDYCNSHDDLKTNFCTGVELSGTNNNGALNLKSCVGECDNDRQCDDGLLCFQRSNGEKIPGCNGPGGEGDAEDAKGWDYCYDPNLDPSAIELSNCTRNDQAMMCYDHWNKLGKPEGRTGFPEDCVARTGVCYLKYCNAHVDLMNAFCGGEVCTTTHQVTACHDHWGSSGKTESFRTENPEECARGSTAIGTFEYEFEVIRGGRDYDMKAMHGARFSTELDTHGCH